MVDTIRVKASQTMVNYRTPTSFLIRETYPLPPYSSVVGMVHRVCGFDSWRPMRVSVQGRTRGIVSDMFTRYAFGNQKFEAGRHQLSIPVDQEKNVNYGVSRGIAHTELLVDVELVLHIQPEREEDFEPIFNGLKNPEIYPALGRHEDLLDILSVERVRVTTQEEAMATNFMYVPVRLLEETRNDENLVGTVYRLHKEYEIDAKSRRRWKDTIETRFLGGGQALYDFEADDDGLPVAFA